MGLFVLAVLPNDEEHSCAGYEAENEEKDVIDLGFLPDELRRGKLRKTGDVEVLGRSRARDRSEYRLAPEGSLVVDLVHGTEEAEFGAVRGDDERLRYGKRVIEGHEDPIDGTRHEAHERNASESVGKADADGIGALVHEAGVVEHFARPGEDAVGQVGFDYLRASAE